MGASDIGEIDAFAPLRELLLGIDGIKAVVPMGIATATVFGGTEIDRVLNDLRVSTQAADAEGTKMRFEQLGQIVGRMRKEALVQLVGARKARSARELVLAGGVGARRELDEFFRAVGGGLCRHVIQVGRHRLGLLRTCVKRRQRRGHRRGDVDHGGRRWRRALRQAKEDGSGRLHSVVCLRHQQL